MLEQAIYALLLGSSAGLEFMTSAQTAGSVGGYTANKPAGLEVGDLVIGLAMSGSAPEVATSGGSVWSKNVISYTGSPDRAAVLWKFMTSTDVANAWDVNDAESGLLAVRYRANGANAVAVKQTANGSGSSVITIPGYAKAASHYASIAVASEVSVATLTPPAAFAERAKRAQSLHTGIITDNFGSYVDGSSVSVGGSSTAAYAGWLLEVTGL